MLILRIVSVVSVIVVASACDYFRKDSPDVKIIDDRKGNFESEILKSLETTKNFFAQYEVGIATDVASNVVGFVPFVGSVVGPLIPIVTGALADETDWKESFAKTITDQTHRAIALNNVHNMEAVMKTISSNINFLKGDLNFTSTSVTAIIHNIHDDISKLANTFSLSTSIFRQYPLLAVKSLFSMATLVSVFQPMQKLLVPALAQASPVTCNFKEVLLEYRTLAATDRIKQLKVEYSHNDLASSRDLTGLIADVSRRPYNPKGYSTFAGPTIRCLIGCNFGCYRGKFCFKDLLNPNKNEYFSVSGWGGESNCKLDYIELLRFRVEQEFEAPVELATNACDQKGAARR